MGNSNKKIKNKNKYIKEGRGKGELKSYKPWFKVRSFPSRGWITRTKSTKAKRLHITLSNLELNYFYMLEWMDNVKDIREQYPLLNDDDITKIAKEKGIRVPKNHVFTTDFLITKKIGDEEILVARTVKPSEDLNKPRVMELFEIEKEYWNRIGVDWAIVTEKEIPEILVMNLKWMRKCSCLEQLKEHITCEFAKKIIDDINNSLYLLENRNERLLKFIMTFDSKYNLKEGISLYLFKYGVFNKIININMDCELVKNPYIKDILKKGVI